MDMGKKGRKPQQRRPQPLPARSSNIFAMPWLDFCLGLLLFFIQVAMPMTGIQPNFWFGFACWVIIIALAIHIVWIWEKTQQWRTRYKLASTVFISMTMVGFVFTPLRNQWHREHHVDTPKQVKLPSLQLAARRVTGRFPNGKRESGITWKDTWVPVEVNLLNPLRGDIPVYDLTIYVELEIFLVAAVGWRAESVPFRYSSAPLDRFGLIGIDITNQDTGKVISPDLGKAMSSVGKIRCERLMPGDRLATVMAMVLDEHATEKPSQMMIHGSYRLTLASGAEDGGLHSFMERSTL